MHILGQFVQKVDEKYLFFSKKPYLCDIIYTSKRKK